MLQDGYIIGRSAMRDAFSFEWLIFINQTNYVLTGLLFFGRFIFVGIDRIGG